MSTDAWWTILHHRELDSTQAEARRRLQREGSLDRLAVVADVQRAGVGRFRRAFDSPAGGSWQTLVLPAPEDAGHGGRLTVSLAAGLAEAFADRDRDLRLKWPNDLYLGGRKCGGVLVERVRGHLLIGVGVNAENQPPPGCARVELPPGEVGRLVRDVVRDVVVDAGRRGEGQRTTGAREDLQQVWRRRDLLRGRTVTVGGRRGVASGIAGDGALRLRLPTGEVVQVHSGTVQEIDPPIEPQVEPGR